MHIATQTLAKVDAGRSILQPHAWAGRGATERSVTGVIHRADRRRRDSSPVRCCSARDRPGHKHKRSPERQSRCSMLRLLRLRRLPATVVRRAADISVWFPLRMVAEGTGKTSGVRTRLVSPTVASRKEATRSYRGKGFVRFQFF